MRSVMADIENVQLHLSTSSSSAKSAVARNILDLSNPWKVESQARPANLGTARGQKSNNILD
jgi:hypothetical protein